MKIRETVNGLKIRYDDDTDELKFEKDGTVLTLLMGEDNLNLLYQMTPYRRYKNFLLSKQNFKCKGCGKDLAPSKASEYALHHEPRLGEKGLKYVDFKGSSENRIICKEYHSKHHNSSIAAKTKRITSTSTASKDTFNIISVASSAVIKMNVENELLALGYQKIGGKSWIKGKKVVHVEQTRVNSHGCYLIYWRESWKDDYAIVFDYSNLGGPVSIVPIKELFTTKFVSDKRNEGYGNSLNWWSQKFPTDHELSQLVLKYQKRWDLL
ncbi:hypothetical protein GX831_04205 [bacterium]|nr:hypothetical protein [bacterium]